MCKNTDGLPGFSQKFNEVLKKRKVQFIRSMKPNLKEHQKLFIRSMTLTQHTIKTPIRASHLKIAQQILESRGIWDDRGLVTTIHSPNQREGQVQNMAVQQRPFLLQQHGQQLQQKFDERSDETHLGFSTKIHKTLQTVYTINSKQQ